MILRGLLVPFLAEETMIEYYAISLAIAYCIGAFFYWCTHGKPAPVIKPYTEMDAIVATAQYYKDLDTKKGYIHAFEAVRNNPNRVQPKPNEEKMKELRRKALRDVT
jgi:hypothetical protein